MNKKESTSLKKNIIGSIIGLFGFIIVAFGSALNNGGLILGGIVAVTLATWLISYGNKYN